MPVGQASAINLDEAARTALRLLEGGRADLAGPHVDALMAAAPHHQAVRRLEIYRRIMSMEEAAKRRPLELGPRAAIFRDRIDLVAFHVDLPSAPSGIHKQINYTEVLRLAFRAAELRAPRARRIILTDESTAFPEDIGAHEIRRLPVDRGFIMYERMRAQLAYLEGMPDDCSCILMDSDVVVNRDPVEAFAQDFEVALTWRPGFPDAPFNGGLIFVADAAQGRTFMRRVLACYARLASDARIAPLFDRSLKAWWGDQYALAVTVGYRAFAERSGEAMSIDGIRVAFLPCAEYNVTLEPDRSYARDELRQKHFVHFKGNRKAMLAEYVRLMGSGAL